VKVRFAVSVGGGPPEPGSLAHVVEGAEARHFDTLWMSDVPSLPAADPVAATAFAAARTSRVRLGINLIPFGAEPYTVAHRLAQLDRLTGGRLLVNFVPGLDLPGERAALGTAGRHRGRLMDELIPRFRRWWAGEEMPVGADTVVRLPVLPVQQPLEVWLGGQGPEAITRAGRLADGWLGSAVDPRRAGRIRLAIQAEAEATGRKIDPDHFGLSIAYARSDDDLEAARGRIQQLRSRRPPGSPDPASLVPVGRDHLRRLIGEVVDRGLSKFVLRPVGGDAGGNWGEELDWLAEAVLDLQT
jgi:probable F420-dependent oxidoreductase